MTRGEKGVVGVIVGIAAASPVVLMADNVGFAFGALCGLACSVWCMVEVVSMLRTGKFTYLTPSEELIHSTREASPFNFYTQLCLMVLAGCLGMLIAWLLVSSILSTPG